MTVKSGGNISSDIRVHLRVQDIVNVEAVIDTIDTGFSLVDFNETCNEYIYLSGALRQIILCIEAMKMSILIFLVHCCNRN